MAAKKTPAPKTPRGKKAAPAPKPAPPAPPDYSDLPIVDQVRAQHAFILACYATGHTLAEIGAELKPPLMATQIRLALAGDTELYRRWKECGEHRSHHFIEEAGLAARMSMVPKERGELFIKLAEKTAPHIYGAKSTVALTGANDGPIASVVEMTPTEAYQRMLKGG